MNNNNNNNNSSFDGRPYTPYGGQPYGQPTGQHYGAPQYSGYSTQQTQQTAPLINLNDPVRVTPSAPQRAKVTTATSTEKKKFIYGILLGVIACVIIGIVAGVIVNALDNDSANGLVEGDNGVSLNVEDSPVTNVEDNISSGETLSYAQIAHSVRSAVVGITVYSANSGWGSYAYSEGSGFIISEDGYVVTNSHVIGDEENVNYQIAVTITDENGESKDLEATVVGYDTRTDIAVLKIDPAGLDLVVVEIGDSSALVPGDEVVAIGNPGGSQFAGSITNGIVSGVDRVIDDTSGTSDNATKYIQTNAAINPGNSGGPLLNMYGQVIGINSSKIVASGYEGLGFAIPMATAKPIIEALIEDGAIIRPILGITCSELSEQLAQWYDVPQGLLIKSINANSDLNNTNIVVGDIITLCDGVSVYTVSELQNVIETKNVGDTVTLTIFRRGETSQFEVDVLLISDKTETTTSTTYGDYYGYQLP